MIAFVFSLYEFTIMTHMECSIIKVKIVNLI